MIFIVSLLLTQVSVPEDVTILNATGDTLSVDAFVENLTGCDVIFVGEHHDAKPVHSAELAIFTEEREPRTVASAGKSGASNRHLYNGPSKCRSGQGHTL